MVHDLTRRLRDFLKARAKATGGIATRCADKESALLWMQNNPAAKYMVALTVPSQQPDGVNDADRRNGKALCTVRLYIGLAPGVKADADANAEMLMLIWALVWSWMSRVRFGSVEDTGDSQRKKFIPLDGYLDGNNPPVPGKAEFSRALFKDTQKENLFELHLAQQDFTFQIAMRQVAAGPDDTGDNFYLNDQPS